MLSFKNMLTFNYKYIDSEMKISKQIQKLKNLNIKAENCLTRVEAKKIISKATKAQSKIKVQKK